MAYAETGRVVPILRVGACATETAPVAPDLQSRHLAFLGARARAIAWMSILAGALSGMVMGLWSFDGPFLVPDWIGEYDALPRRFLRLSHVALFALGALHLLLASQLSKGTMPLAHRRTAFFSMAAGNILMPMVLLGAAVWEPLKYLTVAPATFLTIAIGIAAGDAVRALRRT